MDEVTRQGIARIVVLRGGEPVSRGTGCLVSEDGLVLTALHVVAGGDENSPEPLGGEIQLCFPGHRTSATLLEDCWCSRDDWALLRCEAPPPAVPPIPLTELRSSGEHWETFGFPDANPRDGMVISGTVRDHLADLAGVPAFQLFSVEAAAANGAPVRGLSGAPVLIDGAAAGHLRFALMRDGMAVAGTVYACPAARVSEGAGHLLPLPDPCRGLPGLPRQPLPARPYRYLERFTARDAEIFFGRNREIRSLYDRLTAEESAPVVLLYGRTGVGKSSFLEAGALPRLGWNHTVRHVRRGGDETLLECASSALGVEGESTHGLRESWARIEERTGKPVLLLLDQLEEAFTDPSGGGGRELHAFAIALSEVFGSPAGRPRGKVLLAFRKEWLPEVQNALDEAEVDYSRLFLRRLDRSSVVEVVQGLASTRRLRERYGLEIEDGLAEIIADDLAADRGSPLAPTLQVLMTRMWEVAEEESADRPAFRLELYGRLSRSGYLLDDFLDRQLAQLSEENPEWVESGLVLDVLAFHTTKLATAGSRSLEQTCDRYDHRRTEIPDLLRSLQDLYLLSEEGEGRCLRLAHDTLAPLVRKRFDESDLPGQRARRVLEGRAGEWNRGKRGATLDARDLALVDEGLQGTRSPNAAETRLLEASRRARATRRRRQVILWCAATAAVLALFASTIISVRSWRAAVDEKERAELLRDWARVPSLLESEPVDGLLLAIGAAERSLQRDGEMSPSSHELLLRALQSSREARRLEPLTPAFSVRSAAVDPGSGLVAFSSSVGGSASPDPLKIWTWHPEEGRRSGPFEVGRGHLVSIAVTRGQEEIALLHPREITLLSSRGVQRDVIELPLANLEAATAIACMPDGKILAIGTSGGAAYVVSRRDGHIRGPIAMHDGRISSMAFQPEGDLIVSGSLDARVKIWDTEGSLVLPPLLGHVDSVTAVDIGARYAVSGGEDGTVRRWDLENANPTPSKGGHVGSVSAVRLSPDERLVASGGEDGWIFLWDAHGSLVGGLRGHHAEITGLGFLEGKRSLASASRDGTLRVWDLGSDSGIGAFPIRGTGLHDVAFDSTSHRLAGSGRDGRIHFWDARGGEPGTPLGEKGADLRSIAFSPRGDRIAAADAGGRVSVWELESRTLLARWQHPARPDDLQVAFLGPGDQVLGWAPGLPARHWDLGRTDSGPTGSEIIMSESAVSWDCHDRCSIIDSAPEAGVVVMHYSGPFLSRLYGSSLALGDLDGNAFAATALLPEFDESPLSVEISANARSLAMASKHGSVLVMDRSAQNAMSSVFLGSGTALSLAFSPKGDLLATGTNTGRVQLWTLQGAPFGEPLLRSGDPIADLAFSPDGERLAAVRGSDEVHLWRIGSRSLLDRACARVENHSRLTAGTDDLALGAREVCDRIKRETPESLHH